MSRPVSRPADIPALYATLRRALAVLGRIGVQAQIVGQDELAIYSTLFESHDQASLATFLDATIGPLISHDSHRGSDLAATLLAYFDCNQNAKTTAQRLGIHVNTVRQRLSTSRTCSAIGGRRRARSSCTSPCGCGAFAHGTPERPLERSRRLDCESMPCRCAGMDRVFAVAFEHIARRPASESPTLKPTMRARRLRTAQMR